jgi:hypothetical protein
LHGTGLILFLNCSSFLFHSCAWQFSFFFLPLIIVSFDLFLWHVPLLFFVIALSYIYVHDVSLTFPSPSWNSFIWFLCMQCCLFLFLSCSFLFNSFLCMTILLFFFFPPRIVSLYFHAHHVSLFFLLNCSFLVFNFCAWQFSYFSFLIYRLFWFIYAHGISLIFRFFFYGIFISNLCMIPLSTLLIPLTLPLIQSIYHHIYLFSVQGTSLTGPS